MRITLCLICSIFSEYRINRINDIVTVITFELQFCARGRDKKRINMYVMT